MTPGNNGDNSEVEASEGDELQPRREILSSVRLVAASCSSPPAAGVKPLANSRLFFLTTICPGWGRKLKRD